MTLEQELYNRLKNFSGLTALVAHRIYPILLPQDSKWPALCYQRVSTTRESVMGADTGDARARIQISIYGKRYADDNTSAYAVRDQVRAALQRYNGGVIQDCMLEGENHEYMDDAKLHRVILDFLIWYKE